MNLINLEIITALILYVLQLIIAIKYYKNQPESINHVYGYRTRRSMKSLDSWKFANKIASTYLLVSNQGFLLVLILGVLGVESKILNSAQFRILGIISYILSWVCIFVYVEYRLSKDKLLL